MPIKPHKGEDQSAFMARCMHELGQSDTKRPQEQKVAICMSAWRDAHGGSKPSKGLDEELHHWIKLFKQKQMDDMEPEDGESHQEFISRCMDEMDDREACEMMWQDSIEDTDDEGDSGKSGVIDTTRGAGGTINKTTVCEGSGFDYILSDATIDRFGDTIDPNGWDIKDFSRNPVAPWWRSATLYPSASSAIRIFCTLAGPSPTNIRSA